MPTGKRFRFDSALWLPSTTEAQKPINRVINMLIGLTTIQLEMTNKYMQQQKKYKAEQLTCQPERGVLWTKA